LRWQFKPVLAEGGQREFVQMAPSGTSSVLSDGGQSLWSGGDRQLTIDSGTHPVLVGIVDSTLVPGDCVIRFNVREGTNCLQLLVGAGGDEENFNALRIVLDSTAFGQVFLVSPPTPLVAPAQILTPTLHNDQNNLVEVAIEGRNVAVRINGEMVSRVQAEQAVIGKIGIMANLQQSTPKLEVSDLRILMVPSL